MKFIRRGYRRRYRKARRFVVRHLLHADDPPHRLAMGVAIGLFWTFTPFLGAQMLLVVACAWLFRANKVVGLPLVWISNPATFVPIFYPCYCIGRWMLGWPSVGRQWWSELTVPPGEGWEVTEFYWGRVMEIFAPLMVGSVMVALPIAALGYFVTREFVIRYRTARTYAIARKAERRREAATATDSPP